MDDFDPKGVRKLHVLRKFKLEAFIARTQHLVIFYVGFERSSRKGSDPQLDGMTTCYRTVAIGAVSFRGGLSPRGNLLSRGLRPTGTRQVWLLAPPMFCRMLKGDFAETASSLG